ncbi:hypothetical protein [Aquimarina algiphila]|uniref:hypothetical protein n=1 Tax=Aquimarina algiphila TaxID=2047982 RepID=UPI00232E77BE|nr:hypothetical protein [Aquimarina algiphila]
MYTELSVYRDTGFKNNGFSDIEIGVAFFNNFWISPEIGTSYSFGTLEDQNKININDHNSTPNAILETRYNASLLTISPKINIGRNNENLWWVIQPKFFTGNLIINSNYLTLSEPKEKYEIIESQKRKSTISFFNLSIGLEGYITESEKLSLAFFIRYTTMQLSDRFKSIKFNTPDISNPEENTQTLGIGLKLYFNPFKKE